MQAFITCISGSTEGKIKIEREYVGVLKPTRVFLYGNHMFGITQNDIRCNVLTTGFWRAFAESDCKIFRVTNSHVPATFTREEFERVFAITF